jgi:hypothetical protein
MKLAKEGKRAPSTPPSRLVKDESLFFRAMVKAAELTRKELIYDLRVSDTLVDGWMNGTKNDPFTQARKAVKPFIDKKRRDLLPAIVAYIIGVDNFDEVVLDRIERALKVTP